MLVELMPETPERQHRTQAYPHLLGAAKLLGWEASWHALGVRYNPTLRYGLPPADLKLLLAEIERLAPSVVVINEQLIDSQQAAVKVAAPGGARLVYCSLGENFIPQFPDFLRGLGAEICDARLDDAAGRGPGFPPGGLNMAPWAPDPLIRVVTGALLLSHRVDENPFYRGLKLTSKTMGCTFCATPPDGDCLRDIAAFAAGQVAAAVSARGREPSYASS